MRAIFSPEVLQAAAVKGLRLNTVTNAKEMGIKWAADSKLEV